MYVRPSAVFCREFYLGGLPKKTRAGGMGEAGALKYGGLGPSLSLVASGMEHRVATRGMTRKGYIGV